MRLQLDTDELIGDFFEGSILIGINAPVKGYQLCWIINNRFQIDFRINPELQIVLEKKQRKYHFPVYCYKEPNGGREHYLYCNSFDGEFLLPELRHLDFLWLLKGETVSRADVQELQKILKSLEVVQLATEITEDKLRNKTNLLF